MYSVVLVFTLGFLYGQNGEASSQVVPYQSSKALQQESHKTKENFMSLEEYGKMLYRNPHGISCVACHGEKGEGRLIAQYREKGVSKSLVGSDIRFKSLKEFEKILSQPYHPIMPRYYFTTQEVKAIYSFIVKQKLEEEF